MNNNTFIHRTARAALLLFTMLTASTAWGQETNKKFSMTTNIFMNELQVQKEQQAAGMRRAPATGLPKPQRLIASPDTIGGVAYISCFIHLNDPSDLSAVRALGVKVQGTFDGLDFITASVPVNQLEALADVDNVTNIEVARLMHPTSDVARQKTNVSDLLTQSASASALGVSNMYDGTGVVLGIVDTGIDFQHIAFKDKEGNSRIKRAYVYNGTGSGVIYKDEALLTVTTDDVSQDHGTHVASTAGGSSVIVTKIANDNFTITVTDDHANATFGGMAPGADLYLAGINGLKETELTNAIQKIVLYADSVEKPVVVSNSWGSQWGPHNGTGTLATFISQYFGESHPNHIILFASSNDASHASGSDGGGFFVKKSAASQTSPLGSIMRTRNDGGNSYADVITSAWASSKLNCKLYVLNNTTGEVLKSWTVTKKTSSFDGLDTYYTGSMTVYVEGKESTYCVGIISNEGLTSTSDNAYTLAIEVYPEDAETTADINMWSGNNSYFTSHLTTAGHSWTNGTNDMCVSDEATIPDAISIGAYVSKHSWTNYQGTKYHYTTQNPEGDIATFSSYATAEMSPTGQAYPWITAPGAAVVAGVNHLHTTAVDDESYFGEKNASQLVVNNANNPYGKMQGTSMATPVAAGIVALWLQAATKQSKTLTVNQVKEIMQLSAINDEYTTGANASHFGNGKIDALAGLYAINGGLSLADNAYNSKKIAVAAETANTYNVTLTGRTLSKNGEWNTLCLPFDVTLADSPLAGAEARTLSSATLSEGMLTLNFSEPVSTLTAGTPYLIKWASGDPIESPEFTGVTIKSTEPTPVNFTGGSFVGQYSPFTIDNSNKDDIILLSTGNKLGYSKNARTLRSFRCHFEVPALANAPAMNNFAISFDNETTGIVEMRNEELDFATPHSDHGQRMRNAWYTLDGRRLGGKPTKAGLYIHGNKKVMIK